MLGNGNFKHYVLRKTILGGSLVVRIGIVVSERAGWVKPQLCHFLGDPGHATSLLCASILSSVKWGTIRKTTCPTRLDGALVG